MSLAVHNTRYQRNFSLPILIVLALLSAGGAVWALWSLPLKWAAFTILGLLFPFALAFTGQPRRMVMGLLVFMVPMNIDFNLMFHPSPGGANGFTIGMTEIFLVILMGMTFNNLLKHKHALKFHWYPAITWPVMGLFAFYLVSMLNARDLLWSAFDLFSLLKTWLFFLFLANNLQSKTDIKIVIAALAAGLLLQAVFVAMQFYNGDAMLSALGLGEANKALTFEMQSSMVNRPGGTVGHCNHLARYIGLVLPVTIVLALVSYRRSWRLGMSLVTLAGMAALIFTLTRSSWLGLFISVCVMLPLMFMSRLINFRALASMMGITILALLVVFAFKDVILGRLVSDDLGSARTRWTTAKVAFDIIKDHPFIGVGINNYGSVLEEYWIAEDTFTRRAAVHNTYLLYMAEIGILGFLVYIWLLTAFIARTFKAVRSHIKYYSAVAIGVMGSLTGFLIMAFPDKSYKENLTLLLVFFCLAAVIESMNRMTRESYLAQPGQLTAER